MMEVSLIFLALVLLIMILWPRFQRFCLWLVWDSNIRLGRLAPWVFAIGVGRWPQRVDKKERSIRWHLIGIDGDILWIEECIQGIPKMNNKPPVSGYVAAIDVARKNGPEIDFTIRRHIADGYAVIIYDSERGGAWACNLVSRRFLFWEYFVIEYDEIIPPNN